MTTPMSYQASCDRVTTLIADARSKAEARYPDDPMRQSHMVIGALASALEFTLAGIPLPVTSSCLSSSSPALSDKELQEVMSAIPGACATL